MKLFPFILLILNAISLSANPGFISKLGIEKGLSNEYILSITQDKDGFLWFATEEGLNKFDGTHFISYYKHTASISANELNDIYADPNEPIIWIATQRAGLNAFNYDTHSLVVYTHDDDLGNSLITNDVTSIYPAQDGNLWLSTYHGGVEYFNKSTGEFTHYNASTIRDFVCNNIWSVLDDEKGYLYIGYVVQGLSILSLKDNRIENFKHDPSDPYSLPGNDVRCIYKDRNNNIWVGTENGLALFNPETKAFIKMRNGGNGVLSSPIFDIKQTDDNNLWIATELNGVAVIDLRQYFFEPANSLTVHHYKVGYNKYSLSNPTVRCIFQDSFKNMWLGTYGGGINFIGHTQPLFNSYSFSPIPNDSNSLNNRTALSISIDKHQKLWIGTDGGGINIFDKGRRIDVYNKENRKIKNNTIQASFRDSENNIWLGAFWGGVYLYDDKEDKIRQIGLNGSYNEDIRVFFEDKDKNIWIGTSNGIFLVNKSLQVINYYSDKNSHLPENTIRAISQDYKEQIWIGTFGHGLAIFTKDMEHIKTFNNLNDFCSNTINYIYKDSDHRMWIATGDGLVCFDSPDSLTYKTFERNDGLYNTHIRAITEDDEGNIWFSTNAGISCYLKTTGKIMNYNYFDKTPMGSFTNTAAKDANNIIYFGSNNGVRYFDPVSVLKKKDVPSVIISEITIYETGQKEDIKITSFNEKTKFNYKQNTFNIKFNILDYSLINQVDYEYMLKGVDEAWNTTQENNITYRNIPAGEYVFQIRSRIRNQNWSENITELPIRIAPPLWLTWWAKIIYLALALCFLIYLLHTYKKRLELKGSYEMEKRNREHEQELNNERLRFYTNITHELRTPLSLILGPLEDLEKDTQLLPKQKQKIAVVRQSALRLLNLINQILEFRKTETQNKKLCVSKGNIAQLIKEISLKYKELNRKPDVRFSINIENQEMPLYFDREIVTIIVDNLLSNAFKYTDKGEITLSLYTTATEHISYTHIKVKDTGYGIPQDEQSRIFDRYYQAKRDNEVSGTGIGLALVKNLVALHEGQIRVESKLGEGSSFIFSLLTHNIYTNALHSDDEKEEETIEDDIENVEIQTGNEKPLLLVVEDNADIRSYIKESFTDSFEVITANEGEAGCKQAFSKIPDIIVSDIMMPGMNGITFCKIVKEDVRTSHIPVILLTAKDSLQDKEEGYSSGADSYLTKPFSASLLHSRINNLLESRKKMASLFGNNIVVKDKNMILRESLNKLDNEFLTHITQIIEENLDSDKVNITFLSDRLAMSSSTLFRKIKALTGISTNEFIRKIRMKNAEELLLTGKYNVSEVAFKVGINSPVYFRQCFKEEFGISPSEYIKNPDK